MTERRPPHEEFALQRYFGIGQQEYDAYRKMRGLGHVHISTIGQLEADRVNAWLATVPPKDVREMGLHLDHDTNKSVVQPWATKISMMQQSVLFGIVRGPDGIPKYHPVKPVLRWYRRCLLKSAMDGEVIDNPHDTRGGSFTGPSFNVGPLVDRTFQWEIAMGPLVDEFFTTMDQMPIHFWLHMMHAVEIMGFHHDNPRIAIWWNKLYIRMVEAMHVYPETKEQLDVRLGDTREGWLARSDPAITK